MLLILSPLPACHRAIQDPSHPRQVSKLLLDVSCHVIYRDDWHVDDIASLLSGPEIVALCQMSAI